MKNIVLIGFMGCGKTSVGIRLSRALNMKFCDTDFVIERNSSMSISEIFEAHGEAYFRELETKTIKSFLTTMKDTVLSTGGGLPLRECNQKLLKELGLVVYLKVSPLEIYWRLKNDTTRPLLQGDNPKGKIEELMKLREPIYEKAANIIIKTDNKSFDVIIQEIVQRCEVSP